MRNVIQSGKKKGITFSAFQIYDDDASEDVTLDHTGSRSIIQILLTSQLRR